jgi:hypothetical protein
VVIPPTFENADNFSDGLAAVQLNKAWGYIDKSGTMKIAPRYTVARQFQDGLAAAVTVEANAHAVAHLEDNDSDECTLIDKTGKTVSTLKGYWPDPTGRPFVPSERFCEGLLPVTSSKTVMKGFMGEDGTLKIEAKFDDVRAFGDGVAPAKQDDSWGYIDKSGNWVIQPTAKDIAKGQTITEEDLESHEVQASVIPANAVSSMKSLVGTKAPREIPARQVVTLGP